MVLCLLIRLMCWSSSIRRIELPLAYFEFRRPVIFVLAWVKCIHCGPLNDCTWDSERLRRAYTLTIDHTAVCLELRNNKQLPPSSRCTHTRCSRIVAGLTSSEWVYWFIASDQSVSLDPTAAIYMTCIPSFISKSSLAFEQYLRNGSANLYKYVTVY